MNQQTQFVRLTKYSMLAAGWAGKALIVLAFLATLGFTQNFYCFDVRLNNSAPMVEVRLVLSNRFSHVSWHKTAEFLGRLFHSKQPSQEACRCPDAGRQTA